MNVTIVQKSASQLTSGHNKRRNCECRLHGHLCIDSIMPDRHRNPDDREDKRQHKRYQSNDRRIVLVPRANKLKAFGLNVRQHVHGLKVLLWIEPPGLEEIDDIRRSIAAQVVGFDAFAKDRIIAGHVAYLRMFRRQRKQESKPKSIMLTLTLSMRANRRGSTSSPKPLLYCSQEYHMHNSLKVCASLFMVGSIRLYSRGTAMDSFPTKILTMTTSLSPSFVASSESFQDCRKFISKVSIDVRNKCRYQNTSADICLLTTTKARIPPIFHSRYNGNKVSHAMGQKYEATILSLANASNLHSFLKMSAAFSPWWSSMDSL